MFDDSSAPLEGQDISAFANDVCLLWQFRDSAPFPGQGGTVVIYDPTDEAGRRGVAYDDSLLAENLL